MMRNKQQVNVLGTAISIMKFQQEDYICITDMLKAKDGEFFISDWIRNRNTIEFLGIWEEIHNPNFNYGEFATIKSRAWLNTYKISIKEWVKKTRSIGLLAKSGRYGGTYAHKDIAFEFGMRISPKFKIYLIKEFQRLKEQELKTLDRDVKRFLTKMNYRIHTDAIKENLVPKMLSPNEIDVVYADEADLLNIALFGITAKLRRENNPEKPWNIRDYATIEQLIILANMESLNAEYIKMWYSQSQRLESLNRMAISQMKSLLSISELKSLPVKKEEE